MKKDKCRTFPYDARPRYNDTKTTIPNAHTLLQAETIQTYIDTKICFFPAIWLISSPQKSAQGL